MAFDSSIVKPRFVKLWNHYPYGTPDEARRTIGGQVLKDWGQGWGTCAVRVSRSLNYAGVRIPAKVKLKTGVTMLTFRGADDRAYALRVVELAQWLREMFGPPIATDSHVDPKRGVSYRKFQGRSGIIVFYSGTGGGVYFGGHIDLWDGERPRNATYFRETSKVQLWEFR